MDHLGHFIFQQELAMMIITTGLFCNSHGTSNCHQGSQIKDQTKGKGNISLFFFKFFRFWILFGTLQSTALFHHKRNICKIHVYPCCVELQKKKNYQQLKLKLQAVLYFHPNSVSWKMQLLSFGFCFNKKIRNHVFYSMFYQKTRQLVLQHDLQWKAWWCAFQGFLVSVFLGKIQPRVLPFVLLWFAFLFQTQTK